MFGKSKNIIISTGNVLNINRKAGQKTQEEVIDCLKLTLSDPFIDDKTSTLARNNDDLLPKISEHERNNIKIGAKIFINKPCPQQLESAIDYLLNTLKIDYLDNLILSYHLDNQLNGLIKHQNGDNINGGTSNDQLIDHLKLLWKILENYATTEKINQLGIADIDTDTLIELYSDCEIKPTIVQINLAACCVVPPSLQEFCATHEIQLLTHSDPEVVLTRNDIAGVDDAFKEFVPVWTSRYQVHVKCRGVLAAKGFIIGADRIDS